MKKKQLINEIMGVPKAVDEWVNLITALVSWAVDEIIKADKFEAREFTYKGEKHPMYGQQTTFDGKNVTKMIMGVLQHHEDDLTGFLDTKTFQEFPLYNPQIQVKLTLFPNEVYEAEGMGDRMGAMHSYTGNLADIKLGKLGKRTIFSRNRFVFDVNLPFSFVESPSEEQRQNLYNFLMPTVGHELTHAYQTYRQLLGGKTTIGFGRETILNMLPQHLKYSETPSWNYFLHLVYLHLSFESNARVTELYYKLKRLKNKDQKNVLDVMSNSEPWKDYKELKDFNAEEFLSKFDAELHNDDPLHDLIMQFMGKLTWQPTQPEKLPSSNEEWLEILINKWDDLIQDGQKTLNDMGLEIPIMEKVPESVKENPIEFFKFFEQRFHKKAEKLRRKLTRVVSLVLQEAEEKQKAS